MISFIIPFYNEEESLVKLVHEIIQVCEKQKYEYEVILVNDGSNDRSTMTVKSLVESPNIDLIYHKKRLGKGMALKSGISKSKGETIVFLDADLQDDPKDLPKFIEKINQNYDLVNGWRKDRKDPFLKTFPSSIFNFFLLKLMLHSNFHDINCGFKVMKRQVLEGIALYGDNYRFLPILADKYGFRTTEVVVSHHPRMFGHSKYGFWRFLSGLLDTLTNYFIIRFSEKPLHFFGLIGGLFFLIGFIISVILTIERLFFGMLLYRRPALLLSVLLLIVGIQIILTGIIGELIVYLNNKKS